MRSIPGPSAEAGVLPQSTPGQVRPGHPDGTPGVLLSLPEALRKFPDVLFDLRPDPGHVSSASTRVITADVSITFPERSQLHWVSLVPAVDSLGPPSQVLGSVGPVIGILQPHGCSSCLSAAARRGTHIGASCAGTWSGHHVRDTAGCHGRRAWAAGAGLCHRGPCGHLW